MLFTLLSTFSYALCFTYNQEKKGFFQMTVVILILLNTESGA